MKLANYFYLCDPDAIFKMFRPAFSSWVSDEKVKALVSRCLEQMPEDVLVSEWFLVEERPFNSFDGNIQHSVYPAICYYLMSSDNTKTYFFRHHDWRYEPPLSIGFSMRSSPQTAKIWVKI
jgi:hypothetical protein